MPFYSAKAVNELFIFIISAFFCFMTLTFVWHIITPLPYANLIIYPHGVFVKDKNTADSK